ncbi:MAG: histidine kinase [Actinomycetota bacterium]|nr:histidine kinase [Actinomycetota bacterium]
MLGALQRRFRRYVLRKGDELPGGYTWPFVVSIDIALVVVAVIAAAQRPVSQWWIAAAAIAVACLPWLVFVAFDVMAYEAFALWLSWIVCTAILLFATDTPITGDFAPVLLSMLAGVVGSVSSMRGGLLAAGSAVALLLAAAGLGRVETPALYLSFIGIGWLVGYLMRIQQQLLLEQRQAQQQLAEHAAADERRRIAREVHDVIAHSLSVTLLHVTGARRGLQEDRDIDEAVDALEEAERLGRQAMADIRSTVGLLDDAVAKTAPEPGVRDLPDLVDDFVRAGLSVSLQASGPQEGVSAAAGLALYRIAQESLANVAKHAPDADSAMTLVVTSGDAGVATLTVTSRLPAPVGAPGTEGRGMRGMRQRVQLLGGTISAGPVGDRWIVRADVPLGDGQQPCALWGRGG